MFIFIIYLYFCIDVMSYVCDIIVFGFLFDDFFTLQIIFLHGKRATHKIFLHKLLGHNQHQEGKILSTIPGLVLVVSWENKPASSKPSSMSLTRLIPYSEQFLNIPRIVDISSTIIHLFLHLFRISFCTHSYLGKCTIYLFLVIIFIKLCFALCSGNHDQ